MDLTWVRARGDWQELQTWLGFCLWDWKFDPDKREMSYAIAEGGLTARQAAEEREDMTPTDRSLKSLLYHARVVRDAYVDWMCGDERIFQEFTREGVAETNLLQLKWMLDRVRSMAWEIQHTIHVERSSRGEHLYIADPHKMMSLQELLDYVDAGKLYDWLELARDVEEDRSVARMAYLIAELRYAPWAAAGVVAEEDERSRHTLYYHARKLTDELWDLACDDGRRAFEELSEEGECEVDVPGLMGLFGEMRKEDLDWGVKGTARFERVGWDPEAEGRYRTRIDFGWDVEEEEGPDEWVREGTE